MEVTVADAVIGSRQAFLLGAVMDLEGPKDGARGATRDVAVGDPGPYVIGRFMRICGSRRLETSRRNARNQLDVRSGVARHGVRAFEQAVVSKGDAFTTAAVAEPGNFGSIDMSVEHTTSNRGKVVDEVLGVVQGGGAGAKDARTGVIGVAHDHIAIAGHMVADVVVPLVVVAVTVANDD